MEHNEKIDRLVRASRYDINDLVEIVSILRGEGGCPWDREQTHKSIRNDLIEETYEVVESIDCNDPALMREELGDLLFQVLFHAQIAREDGQFTLDDVISDISAKMVHRHPHVFGSVQVENTGEVLSNWETIKTEEKQRNTLKDKLQAIPPMLPALMRAQKVAKKSGQYADVTSDELIDSAKRSLDALRTGADTSETLGQILFTLGALAYREGIGAEEALFETTNRFIDTL
jgi:tetrapyrrole methylase family protein/MazG family protein